MTFQIFRGAGALSQARRAAGERPIRAPHHTASLLALTGRLADSRTEPDSPHAYVIDAGEVILANRGILILDNFPEFSRAALEMLAGIYRLQRIKLTKRDVSVELPLYFDVFATAHHCPCGHGDPRVKAPCKCSSESKNRFEERIRGSMANFLLEPDPVKHSSPQ